MHDRPLTSGSALSSAAAVMVKNLPLLGFVTLVLWAPGCLMNATRTQMSMDTGMLLAYAWIPISFALHAFTQGSLIVAALDQMEGRQTSFSRATGLALNRVPSILWTGLCYYFWFYLGLFCFIVPGVLWGIRQLLAQTVTVAEGISGPAALGRSTQLVKAGQGLVGRLVLLQILALVVMSLPTWIRLSTLGTAGGQLSMGLLQVFHLVCSVLYQIFPIALVKVYLHLRDKPDAISEEEVGVGLNPS